MEQLDGDNKYDAGEHGLQVFFFFKSHFKFYFYVLILPYKAMVAKKHCKTHFRLYQLIWVIFFFLRQTFTQLLIAVMFLKMELGF